MRNVLNKFAFGFCDDVYVLEQITNLKCDPAAWKTKHTYTTQLTKQNSQEKKKPRTNDQKNAYI